MSRLFNGPTAADRITFGIGSGAVPPDEGPITMAALCRFTGSATTGTYWVVEGNTSANAGIWGMLVDTNKWFIDNDFTAGGPTLLHNKWMWVVVTKASGSVTPRWHILNITDSAAWSHTAGAGNVGDGSGTLAKILVGGPSNTNVNNTWQGEIAAVATWTAALTDLQVEAACDLLAGDLKAAAPGWMVRLNQSSTATAINDETTGGANQTAISGTTVSANEAPGWSYAIPFTKDVVERYNVFPLTGHTTQTPSSSFGPDGAITLSTSFTVNASGLACLGGRLYAPSSTVDTAYSLALWEIGTSADDSGTTTGTLLATASFATVTPGSGWNQVLFASPVALSTGKVYRIGIRSPAGYYTATSHVFDAGAIVNGPITMLAHRADPGFGTGAVSNGTFITNTTGIPNTSFNAADYFADMIIDRATTGWTKDVVERYRVTNTFTKDVIERYRVYNALTQDVAERYRVFNGLTKDVIERYRVYNTISKDVIERYSVLTAFTKDVVERYRVTNAWTKDVAETYRVFNGLGLDVIERYRVYNGFTKDVVERYSVLAGTQFTKDVVERYRLYNNWVKDTVETYRVFNGFSRDVIERYRVYSAWMIDTIERYRLYNGWTRDVVERYAVLSGTPFVLDLVERYRLYNTLSRSVVERYNVGDTVAPPPRAIAATANLGPVTAVASLVPWGAIADLDDVDA